MALYTYRCTSCGLTYDAVRRLSESDQPLEVPCLKQAITETTTAVGLPGVPVEVTKLNEDPATPRCTLQRDGVELNAKMAHDWMP